MIKSPTISHRPSYPESMDFQKLRKRAIAFLEKHASGKWTDFNLHDPGITILEVLCYAITDLSYRTSFPTADLLAHPNYEGKDFFTAAEILTCRPVTELDFRKLIIDCTLQQENVTNTIKGLAEQCPDQPAPKKRKVIKNAWLVKSGPVEPYLVLESTYVFTEAFLKRLLACIADALRRKMFSRAPFRAMYNEEELHHEYIKPMLEKVRKQFTPFLGKSFPLKPQFISLVQHWLKQTPGLKIKISEKEWCKLIEAALQSVKIDYLSNLKGNPVEISTPVDISCLYTVCLELENDIDASDKALVQQIKEAVYYKLHANRNLCEDYFEITCVEKQPVGLCTEIEVEEDADINEVTADIVYRIQEYLAPTVPFYSLEEMLEMGKTADEIFNGPLLENGFILDEELKQAELREIVYTSDLMNIIMDIPGVKAVPALQLARCEKGKLKPEDLGKACLEIPAKHKAYLNLGCSEFHFKVNDLYLRPDPEEVVEVLDLLEVTRGKPLPAGPFDLAIPGGRYRNPDHYRSIQEEFPNTYGIGENGLPDTADALRRAQARQLQGYLLFFDQLLANYLEQLAQLKPLLSVSQNLETPALYARAFTDEIPGLAALLSAFEAKNDSAKEWEHFINDPYNGYAQKLSGITETEGERLERKNRVLSHLLARFGESFTEYALSLYSKTGIISKRKNNDKTFREYLLAKIAFLKAIPELSSERGKTFNYKALDCGLPDVWDTKNVSGLKKRASHFLCMDDYRRRTLSCPPDFDVEIYPMVEGGKIRCYRFKLIDKKTGETLLGGAEDFRLKKNAQKAADALKNEWALDKENYFLQSSGKPAATEKVKLFIRDESDVPVAESELLSRAAAKALKARILDLAFPQDCAVDGFHLLEHILLRPGNDNYELLQPFCLGKGCYASGPYCFWATVFAPAWADRFEGPEKRAFFERIVRREAPAHIGLRFCYLDNKEMYDFETAYLNWLHENAKADPKEKLLTRYANALIRFVNRFKDDCKDEKKPRAPKCK